MSVFGLSFQKFFLTTDRGGDWLREGKAEGREANEEAGLSDSLGGRKASWGIREYRCHKGIQVLVNRIGHYVDS